MLANGIMITNDNDYVSVYVKCGPEVIYLGRCRQGKSGKLELPKKLAEDLVMVARERQQAELERQRQEQIENSKDSNDR